MIVIKQSDPLYPKRLLNVDKPPQQLYCIGDVSLLELQAIAIVGTRNCTRYGKQVAEKFAKELSDHFVIVSGLADGIDAFAHAACLEAGGKTIAVLGGGFNHMYPKSNMNLFKQICEKGLVISEYSPDTQPTQYNFPFRNRIVAGLSKGVLVPEAGEKSGTNHTIEYALNMGLEVFAVPGPITSPASTGTNKLIKAAQGACVTEPKDILECFGITAKEKQKHEIMQLNMDEQSILDAVGIEETHIDEIITKTGFDIKKINSLLTKLECNGLLIKLFGNLYIKAEK